MWGEVKRRTGAAPANNSTAVLGENRVAEDRDGAKNEAHRKEDPRGESILG